MTSPYTLICPDCGHDARDHGAFDACPRTAASLYAAECTRLALECERSSRNEHATVEESVRRGVRIDTLTAVHTGGTVHVSPVDGYCPTHGEQRGCITVTVNFPLVEKYCISCYADWLAANIPRLTSQDTALDAGEDK